MSHRSSSHPATQPAFLPRLCVTALSGGGGKTLLSLGLCRSFALRGAIVQPFKKGPDYIDAAWLRLAAGLPAANLDPYFLEAPRLRALFVHTMRAAASRANGCPCDDLSAAQSGQLLGLLEGNRGFFDGMDARGSCSTAELSRILSCPVIISVDCTKMTRTAAALVRGMLTFEPGITFAGVVLNQVGSARHERILRQALEEHTDVPVLGALPRLSENPLPERHMGIASCGDDLSPQAQQVLDSLAAFVSGHVDMHRILAAAKSAPALEAEPFWPESLQGELPEAGLAGHVGHSVSAVPSVSVEQADSARVASREKFGNDTPGNVTPSGGPESSGARRPRIGYVRDAALWFYYEENLEALRRAGAELVRLSLLDGAGADPADAGWPQVDGLYLGGGFPEDHVEALTASPLLRQLAQWAAQNMPIYAECGGFMVLSRGIERQGKLWPMGGILPVTAVVCAKPQGLGYVRGKITAVNPFFSLETELRGHEFHYSRCRWEETAKNSQCEEAEPVQGVVAAQNRHPSLRWAMQLHKGQGMGPAPALAGQTTASASDAPKVDGLVFRNVWASYTHIFAPAAP
ncbi:MAG: cobyrinate a,c-diamide synthase, partial [Desulfovibrio sp.]|nr:cobyrinate a,c-diamide synthase [Desulfovibrio sp.]